MDVSTATGFKFKSAVGRLRKCALKLEELFDNWRSSGKHAHDCIGKTSSP